GCGPRRRRDRSRRPSACGDNRGRRCRYRRGPCAPGSCHSPRASTRGRGRSAGASPRSRAPRSRTSSSSRGRSPARSSDSALSVAWLPPGRRAIVYAFKEEEPMDPNAKKTALRMIPYGLYVLTAADKTGQVAAAPVSWVTQASFEPPLVVVGVKADSHAHSIIKESKAFALNVLGKGQQALAFTFFKPAELKGETISGEKFHRGTTGSPILSSVPS